MPIGSLTDYAERSAGVALSSHTEAIFKAFNHEPYTWGRSQEDAGIAYCISIKHIAGDKSPTTARMCGVCWMVGFSTQKSIEKDLQLGAWFLFIFIWVWSCCVLFIINITHLSSLLLAMYTHLRCKVKEITDLQVTAKTEQVALIQTFGQNPLSYSQLLQ